MFKRALSFIAPLLLATLVACGGGGGGGDSSSINTSAATIGASNVDELAGNVVMAIASSITTRVGPYLSILSNVPPAVTAQAYGCLQGSATFTLNRENNTTNVTGTGVYSGFENCAFWTLSGNADVTGQLSYDLIGNFTLTSNDLTFTRTGTTETYHFSGTIELTRKGSVMGGAGGYVMTTNGSVRDSNQTIVYTLKNFTIDSDTTAGQQSILVSGRITNRKHGYIDLSTTNRFLYALPGTTIWSGSFSMIGANKTAVVTYYNGSQGISIN